MLNGIQVWIEIALGSYSTLDSIHTILIVEYTRRNWELNPSQSIRIIMHY